VTVDLHTVVVIYVCVAVGARTRVYTGGMFVFAFMNVFVV